MPPSRTVGAPRKEPSPPRVGPLGPRSFRRAPPYNLSPAAAKGQRANTVERRPSLLFRWRRPCRRRRTGRRVGTRALNLDSLLGIQGLAASGSWTLLMRADRGVWEAFHAMVKSSAWGSSLFQVGRPDPGDHSSTFFGIFMPVSSGAHAASEPSGGERRAGFGCLRGSVRPQYGQRKSRRMILR